MEKQLFLKIYDAASMQRWNDQIKVIEFNELDKQAHKMVLAYILGKFEQEVNDNINWIKIIKIGLFEYFQRIVLTDLKPPLFYRIKKDKDKYHDLNKWTYQQIEPVIRSLGKEFCEEFKNFLLQIEEGIEDINNNVINAAHFYITKWEFDIIQSMGPQGFQIEEIKENIEETQNKYNKLYSVKKLNNSSQLRNFIDVCGQLRFQVRWSHLYRVPRTSVLGHMLIVAIFSYIFSREAKLNDINCINNYFTGLFHDLPEVLTRDIINPVKKSIKGLDELIKGYEKEEMEQKIYRLVPKAWHQDIKLFTENEFSDLKYRNGSLVKAADDLAAFIEAYLSIKNGIKNQDFRDAMAHIKDKYKQIKVDNIPMENLLNQFSI